MPAGSSCALRLDPLSLPVQFPASDAAADGRMRVVELHRERVILRRSVRGMPMAVNLPVSVFLGIALRMVEPTECVSAAVCVTLEHHDPALSIPLFIAADGDDAVAEWQAWAQALRLPLLMVEADGSIGQPFPCLGQVRVGAPAQRRRQRATIKKRRPSILLRRRPGVPRLSPAVHREREIIARR
jgi:hypothetical protein